MKATDGREPRTTLLLRNVLSAGGTRFTAAAIALATTPVIVAGLGMERYGLWALAGVFVNYLAVLDLGVGTAFVHSMAKYHGTGSISKFNAVLRTGVSAYFLFSALLFPVVVAFRSDLARLLTRSEPLVPEMSFLLVGVTAILLLRSIFLAYRAALAAVERLDINNRIAMFLAVPNGIGAVLVIGLGWGLKGLVLNGLLTAGAAVSLQTWSAYRTIPGLRLFPFLPDRAEAIGLLRYGARIQGARIAELINGQVDKILLALLSGTAAVGLYEIGWKVATLAALLPTLILPVILPSTAILYASGKSEDLRTLHERGCKYVGLVLAPAVVALMILLPPFLQVWIGPGDWSDAVWAGRLLILGAVPMLVLGVTRLAVRGIGLPGMEMKASVLMAASNILFSLLLVLRYGPRGAAAGSALAGVTGGIAFLALVRKTLHRHRFRPFAALKGPVLASLAAGVPCAAAVSWIGSCFPQDGRSGALLNLFVAGGVFAAVYAGILHRAGFLDRYDRNIARKTWILLKAGPR